VYPGGVCCDGGYAVASGPGGRYKLIIVNQNTAADTRDDCTLQSKQPWMHASYGLVKTRLICYVGKMRMFTSIGIRIIPVVTSAHLHYTPGLNIINYYVTYSNDGEFSAYYVHF